MPYFPPDEKIIETKKCQLSGKEFFVTDKDLEFYDKISPVLSGKKYAIPSPTLCPEERTRNRMMFRNFMHLYHRNSDLSGKAMISMYRPNGPTKVYTTQEWW